MKEREGDEKLTIISMTVSGIYRVRWHRIFADDWRPDAVLVYQPIYRVGQKSGATWPQFRQILADYKLSLQDLKITDRLSNKPFLMIWLLTTLHTLNI